MRTREPLQLLVCIYITLVERYTSYQLYTTWGTWSNHCYNNTEYAQVHYLMVLEVQSYRYMYMKYVTCTRLHVTNAVH